jgi:hypothetical protein
MVERNITSKIVAVRGLPTVGPCKKRIRPESISMNKPTEGIALGGIVCAQDELPQHYRGCRSFDKVLFLLVCVLRKRL